MESLRRTAGVTRIMSAIRDSGGRIVTTDVASRNAMGQDVRLVLRYGLRSPDKAEKFGVHERVDGKDAVNAGLQPIIFAKSFQQAPH